MCADCFEAVHGWEPDMGDGETTFKPGVCSRCHRDLIVFTLID